MSSFTIERGALLDFARRARRAGEAVVTGNEQMGIRAATESDRDLKRIAFNAAGGLVRSGLFLEAPARFALGVRSGHLAASVVSDLTRFDAHTWVASAGTPLPYALTNEIGGTIRPKNGRALAIPTRNALSPSGDLKNEFTGAGGLRNARPGGRKMFVVATAGGARAGAWLAATAGPGAGTVTRNKRTGRFQRAGRLIRYFRLVRESHVPARYAVRAARRRVDAILFGLYGQRMGVTVLQRFADGGAAA